MARWQYIMTARGRSIDRRFPTSLVIVDIRSVT